MKLPLIQSLWLGNPLSNIEKLCIQSFLDHGHEFRLYVYDEVAGVPIGATIKDATEILPHSAIFKDTSGSVAGFSNWFRYEILCQQPGFWIDMDIICIKPFDFDEPLTLGWEGQRYIGTAVIGTNETEHPLLIAMRDSCRNFPAFNPWDSTTVKLRKLHRRLLFRGREGARHGSVGGPRILTEAMQYYGMTDLVKPCVYFFPIWIGNCQCIFDDTFSDGVPFTPKTYGLHLWNGAVHTNGIDKSADFHPDSLVEQLKRKHGVK